MRDILFRGFHNDENGESKAFVNDEWVKGTWVYGFYVHYDDVLDCHLDDCDYIVERHNGKDFIFKEVITETVVQYTGLKDKNGKKIFEGDIIKDCLDEIGIIEYKPKRAAFVVKNWEDGYILWTQDNIEVIGNIFENPELIEGV